MASRPGNQKGTHHCHLLSLNWRCPAKLNVVEATGGSADCTQRKATERGCRERRLASTEDRRQVPASRVGAKTPERTHNRLQRRGSSRAGGVGPVRSITMKRLHPLSLKDIKPSRKKLVELVRCACALKARCQATPMFPQGYRNTADDESQLCWASWKPSATSRTVSPQPLKR